MNSEHNQPSEGRRIWLIGGTSESAALAQALTEAAIPYIVTVTTESAKALYPASAEVRVGRLQTEQLSDFLVNASIGGILDASHPFATVISKGAIAVAQSHTLPYLRYERAAVHQTSPPPNTSVWQTDRWVWETRSAAALIKSGALMQKRVLLVLGYRHLATFSQLRPGAQLFARILPSTEALCAAQAAGFGPKEVIAIRPPVTAALESALWQQWDISAVVAKASGPAGGETIKRQVATQLGVRLYLIARPQLDYGLKTGEIAIALQKCRKMLSPRTNLKSADQ